MAIMKIGWAEENITPEKRISLAGQFAERISEYVEKPLTVTAMAVECGGDQMVMVSCDLPSVPWDFIQECRRLLKDNDAGLDPRKVMIHAIHTHTGYAPGGGFRTQNGEPIALMRKQIQSYLKPGQRYVEKAPVTESPDIMTKEEGFHLASSGVAKAALEAWKSRKEGSFSNAFDRAAVGLCRRADYSDGTAKMWGSTNTATFTEIEGGNDSGVELLYVFDEKDRLSGVVVNLACPAQCVQHRLFVSPDFWGEAKVLLRSYFGEDLFVLALCGPAGDQCPVDLVRWVNPDTDVNDPNIERDHPPLRVADPSMFDLQGMKKTGRRVARAVEDAWEDGIRPRQKDIRFEHRVFDLQLPLRRVTDAENEEAKERIKSYVREKDGDIDYRDVAKLQKYMGVVKRFSLQENVESVDTEVHVVRMGSVAFASCPFELFLDYGNKVKARQLCEQSFLVQQCCGKEGYLPTEKAEKHGHYSAFVASGQVGHEGGDLLVRKILSEINDLFGADHESYSYKDE